MLAGSCAAAPCSAEACCYLQPCPCCSSLTVYPLMSMCLQASNARKEAEKAAKDAAAAVAEAEKALRAKMAAAMPAVSRK